MPPSPQKQIRKIALEPYKQQKWTKQFQEFFETLGLMQYDVDAICGLYNASKDMDYIEFVRFLSTTVGSENKPLLIVIIQQGLKWKSELTEWENGQHHPEETVVQQRDFWREAALKTYEKQIFLENCLSSAEEVMDDNALALYKERLPFAIQPSGDTESSSA